MDVSLVLAILVTAGPGAKAGAAPDWTPQEMKTLLAQGQAATRAPDLPTQNRMLLAMAATAYRASGTTLRGDLEQISKAVLRRRMPDHPNVKQGQWISALLRRFYDDASARCRVLARFARVRADRAYFEAMAQQTRVAADQLAQSLQLEVAGLDGYSAPLPVVDGDEPRRFGVRATVDPRGGIDVDGMERIRFVGHVPPSNAARTARGSLKKLFSAFQFFERSARALGAYDAKWAKKRGHVWAVIPADLPAVYLNEIALAAREAGSKTLHVAVMTARGDLRELRVDLRKTRGKRRAVDVTCADDITMTLCAQRIAHAAGKGRPRWAFK